MGYPKLTEQQRHYKAQTSPYICKDCGCGSSVDFFCEYCDRDWYRFLWRRGALQTLTVSILCLICYIILEEPLWVAPAGLFLMWNSYLLLTARPRMKKHFKEREYRNN